MVSLLGTAFVSICLQRQYHMLTKAVPNTENLSQPKILAICTKYSGITTLYGKSTKENSN
jgi:hypothetical protein